MSSTVVYATSTRTARMAETARRGINAVANAPLHFCLDCLDSFNTERAYDKHRDDGFCLLDGVCANQSTCIVHDEGIECDLLAHHDGDCDFTGCPCDLSR